MEDIINCLFKSFIEISNIIKNNDKNTLFDSINKSNSSGDSVKKLDLVSNEILKKKLSNINSIRFIGSEEEDKLLLINEKGKYLVCFDPLDGSSNIDVNITVGTIFAIYKYSENVIKNGNNIVIAGYCLYGGSTQLVIADTSVNIYQLNQNTNEFNLLFQDWKIPKKGNIYSINESNKYIIDKKYNIITDKLIDQKYSARWVGSLVADAHRTLIKGGFFTYPENSKNKDGKIRLLYEAYPFAFIFKIANGFSSNGNINLLDVEFPNNIHQKTPIILSSKYEFDLFNSI